MNKQVQTEIDKVNKYITEVENVDELYDIILKAKRELKFKRREESIDSIVEDRESKTVSVEMFEGTEVSDIQYDEQSQSFDIKIKPKVEVKYLEIPFTLYRAGKVDMNDLFN